MNKWVSLLNFVENILFFLKWSCISILLCHLSNISGRSSATHNNMTKKIWMIFHYSYSFYTMHTNDWLEKYEENKNWTALNEEMGKMHMFTIGYRVLWPITFCQLMFELFCACTPFARNFPISHCFGRPSKTLSIQKSCLCGKCKLTHKKQPISHISIAL